MFGWPGLHGSTLHSSLQKSTKSVKHFNYSGLLVLQAPAMGQLSQLLVAFKHCAMKFKRELSLRALRDEAHARTGYLGLEILKIFSTPRGGRARNWRSHFGIPIMRTTVCWVYLAHDQLCKRYCHNAARTANA